MNPIDEFLKNLYLNRYQVEKISQIGESTLRTASTKPVNNLSVKTLRALAMATNNTPGEVLDALIKLEGNPIIQFIEAHPYMNKQLVQDVEDLMIEAHERHASLKNVTFNGYYERGDDTNDRAETALRNTIKVVHDIMDQIEGTQNGGAN